jgi:hypothetical protein
MVIAAREAALPSRSKALIKVTAAIKAIRIKTRLRMDPPNPMGLFYDY